MSDRRANLAQELSHEAQKARIVAAFSPDRKPLTPNETRLVYALLNNPGGTPAALTEAVWGKGTHPSTWQLHFGLACRKREADLWSAPPAPNRKTADGDVAQFFIGLLADWDDATSSFTMKPAAVEAFAELGLRTTVPPR